MLASLLYPYDDDAASLIAGWIAELEREQCVAVYEHDNNTYMQIQKWDKHQKVDRPTASRLPEYSRGLARSREHSIVLDADLGPRILDLGPRTVDPGSGPRIQDLAKSASPIRAPRVTQESKTSEIWRRYSAAYERRYHAEPIRNAKVSGQLANIIDRLGAEEAPHVADWFLAHNERWYVQKGHSVECLQKDCEKLRTEWATGQRITSTQAAQMDRTQTMGDIVRKIITESDAEKAASANRQ